MQSSEKVFVVQTNKTILSSKSLFYKTENFIKQTKNISNIDSLISKLSETIIFNINNLILEEENSQQELSCFSVQTQDKNFRFMFKFGYQIGQSLNKFDIIFFENIASDYGQNIKIEEYLSVKNNLTISVKSEKHLTKVQDFSKLYLVSNVSNINLVKPLYRFNNLILQTIWQFSGIH